MALDVPSSTLSGGPPDSTTAQSTATQGQQAPPTAANVFAIFLGKVTGQPAPGNDPKSGKGTFHRDNGADSHSRSHTDSESVDGLMIAATALPNPTVLQQALPSTTQLNTTIAGTAMDTGQDAPAGGLLPNTNTISTQTAAAPILSTTAVVDTGATTPVPSAPVQSALTWSSGQGGSGASVTSSSAITQTLSTSTSTSGQAPTVGALLQKFDVAKLSITTDKTPVASTTPAPTPTSTASTTPAPTQATTASTSGPTSTASQILEGGYSVRIDAHGIVPHAAATADKALQPQASTANNGITGESRQVAAANDVVASSPANPNAVSVVSQAIASMPNVASQAEDAVGNALKNWAGSTKSGQLNAIAPGSKTARVQNGSTGQPVRGTGQPQQSTRVTEPSTGTETTASTATQASTTVAVVGDKPSKDDSGKQGTSTDGGGKSADASANVTPFAVPAPEAKAVSTTASTGAATSQPLNGAERAALVQQVADQISAAKPLTGTSHVTVQLNPVDWGNVNVRISVAPPGQDGTAQVTAHLVAENASVKAALDSQMGDLRRALEGAGLHLQNASVSVVATSAGSQSGSTGSGADPGQRHNLGNWNMGGQNPSGNQQQGQGSFASFAGNGRGNGGNSQPSYQTPVDTVDAPVGAIPVARASGRLDTRA